MADPARTLPRAMMTSILLVMALYVAVSFAVFGNLPAERVIAAKDYALAEAALPLFGQIGFRVIALAALVSTASAIGSISILFVHGVTHIGHLRRTSETGASRFVVALAALASFGAMALASIYVSRVSPEVVVLLIGFVTFSFGLEFALQRWMGRKILPRVVS